MSLYRRLQSPVASALAVSPVTKQPVRAPKRLQAAAVFSLCTITRGLSLRLRHVCRGSTAKACPCSALSAAKKCNCCPGPRRTLRANSDARLLLRVAAAKGCACCAKTCACCCAAAKTCAHAHPGRTAPAASRSVHVHASRSDRVYAVPRTAGSLTAGSSGLCLLRQDVCLHRAGREEVQSLLPREISLCLYRAAGAGRRPAVTQVPAGPQQRFVIVTVPGSNVVHQRSVAVVPTVGRCAVAERHGPAADGDPRQPRRRASAANRVRLETPQFDAHCNKMTCVGGGDVVLLEGDVEMTCRRNGAAMRVTGQRSPRLLERRHLHG